MITSRIFLFGLSLIFLCVTASARQVLKLRSEDYMKYSRSVMAGARMGVAECDRQFKDEPWNCYVNKKARMVPIFNRARLPLANRETAFVHAVTAAGVMYSVVLNCSLGQLENCKCERTKQRRKKARSKSKNWTWGGCSNNIAFGDLVARNFVDALEGRRGGDGDARRYMNLHNNKVGRKMVKFSTKTVCRCHGSSSSCTMKTCMKKLSTFEKIGDRLRERYEKAIQVRFGNSSLYTSNGQKVTKKEKMDLVYFEKSPDYCKGNKELNVPGVEGRVCEATGKKELKKCKKLCTSCGLKVKLKVVIRMTKCNCKFVWCCHVRCQKCGKDIITVTCSR